MSRRLRKKSPKNQNFSFVSTSNSVSQKLLPLQTKLEEQPFLSIEEIRKQRERQDRFGHDLSNISLASDNEHNGLSPFFQTKLTIGQANDQHQQKTNQVALQVVNKINSSQHITQNPEMQMKPLSGAIQRQDLPSHKDPNERPKLPPDMKPVNWGRLQGGPMPKVPYKVNIYPGATPPKPPNTTRPKPLHLSHHKNEEDYLDRIERQKNKSKVLWTHQLSISRYNAWDAWSKDAQKVQNIWNLAVPGMSALAIAHKDKSLQGRQLMLPSKDWEGGLEELINEQEVGSNKVSDLFSNPYSPSVEMGSRDERSLDKASGAKGQRKTKDAFAKIQQQEHEVDAAFNGVKEASKGIEKAQAELEFAISNIEEAKAKEEEAVATTELAQLQAEIASVKKVMGFVTSIPARIAKIDETFGDMLKSGASFMWEMALDNVYANDINHIKNKIRAAQTKQKDEQTKQLQAQYNGAVAGVQEAVNKFEAAQSKLKAQLVARVRAYDTAGTSVSSAGGGGAGGRQLESIIAAIPRVETMVAKLALVLQSLGQNSDDPVYTNESGIGYGMALYAQKWEAYDFPNVRSWLWKGRWMYGEQFHKWKQRLGNLHNIKTKLEGHIAGGTEQ